MIPVYLSLITSLLTMPFWLYMCYKENKSVNKVWDRIGNYFIATLIIMMPALNISGIFLLLMFGGYGQHPNNATHLEDY